MIEYPFSFHPTRWALAAADTAELSNTYHATLISQSGNH
jgi:hypothetical protein